MPDAANVGEWAGKVLFVKSWLDLILFDLVTEYPFRGLEGTGRLPHVPAVALEGIDQQFPFKAFNRILQGLVLVRAWRGVVGRSADGGGPATATPRSRR